MLPRVVLSAAAKNAVVLGPGVLQATRIFHPGQPPLPEVGGKVLPGLIPEEFFQFLYPKTGVTGLYMLGTGLILYFLSKEIYVITPEIFSTISIVGLLIYVIKIYGASIGESIDEQKIAQLEEVKQTSIKQIQDAIELEKSLQALVQKRYLPGMATKVYKEVKNHLDYHMSVQNMMHRKEQEHIINWVEKHVVQSISAQQEKETIV
ncbi:JHY-like [Ictidomys tridecemlineatus]|uniref:ATP synthase subunit b n=1 Tax=Ictidomys tridecemlineatus TaxID=43179 RepID=A0A287DD83_ICTTR|nr:JHY-like [Ictidomys tridecemlineatus]